MVNWPSMVITISLVIRVQPLDNVSDGVDVGESGEPREGVGERVGEEPEGGADGGLDEELSSGGTELDEGAGGVLEESEEGTEEDSLDDEDSGDEAIEEGGGGSDDGDELGLDEGGSLGGTEVGDGL